ncbi:MAG: hypothetical protein MRECE_10c011 [Mycoplasmataceae bacterium CE_OT135]|nr:MAG: hypothetical protein MRECE_15c001 [Mycoplasmataceae bacterium CE_OT135]KLL03709.1 MAG: hypothetical protein MRECE_10c011 [Mycoplasmataceae bacterium CE_OT135]
MNLTTIQTKLNSDTIKYQFTKDDGSKLTFGEFIQLLKSKDQDFLNAFNEALEQAGSQLSAYFWECVPVSQTTKGKNFEFVVIKSESLDKITQDYSRFQEHFNQSQESVVSFFSFSRDTLVVPIPNEKKNYKNLKEFINNAPSEQKNNFWQKVGEEMEEKLLNADGAPRWLSTHGLGVPYLHVRIDKKPKYYSWKEYKEFKEDNDESNNQNYRDNKSPTNDKQPTSTTNQSEDNPNQPNSPVEKILHLPTIILTLSHQNQTTKAIPPLSKTKHWTNFLTILGPLTQTKNQVIICHEL